MSLCGLNNPLMRNRRRGTQGRIFARVGFSERDKLLGLAAMATLNSPTRIATALPCADNMTFNGNGKFILESVYQIHIVYVIGLITL